MATSYKHYRFTHGSIIGKGNHHGDFGIGLTGITSNNIEPYTFGVKKNRLLAVPRISYRYQKPTGGLMLRVGFTPTVDLSSVSVNPFGPWFGLAIGYSF